MKELSIFVDESGDFGEYNYHSPYYIITMVFHNQAVDISKEIAKCKKVQQISILNAKREEEVIQKNLSYLKNKEYRFVLEGFFRNLMNLSKLIQNEQNDH